MGGIHSRRGSRRRDDDDDDDEEDDRPSRRRSSRGGGFRCPYCDTDRKPASHSKITTGGWITFWVLFAFLCWPVCWVGLMMRENYRQCRGCGMKLG